MFGEALGRGLKRSFPLSLKKTGFFHVPFWTSKIGNLSSGTSVSAAFVKIRGQQVPPSAAFLLIPGILDMELPNMRNG